VWLNNSHFRFWTGLKRLFHPDPFHHDNTWHKFFSFNVLMRSAASRWLQKTIADWDFNEQIKLNKLPILSFFRNDHFHRKISFFYIFWNKVQNSWVHDSCVSWNLNRSCRNQNTRLFNFPMINDICSWKPSCKIYQIHPRLKFDFIHTKFLYRYDLLFPEFLLKLLGLLKFLISVSIECPP
jgi:hypothetical protein